MKNYLAPVLIILAFVAVAGYRVLAPVPVEEHSAPAATTTAVTQVATSSVKEETVSGREEMGGTRSNARMVVGETSYVIEVTPHETLLAAMQALSKSGAFTFSGRDYAGLGFFVDTLNGVSNGGGKYWVYYVNGVSATEGVSSTTFSPGDEIVWKFEAAR